MDFERQLKLQAFLDGELPEAEAREVSNWIARDPEAAALQAELRNTRAAMRGCEAGVTLPESREFFWSKIEREITRSEKPATVEQKGTWFERNFRMLIPAGTFAVVMVTLVIGLWGMGLFSPARRPVIETAMVDSSAVTFRDEAEGTTLVWISFNGENDLADDKTTTIQ